MRTDLPGARGPVFPARTYRRCIDAATTAALLSARSNDTADPPETSYPLPPATFCIVPRREPQLVARDGLVCARPRLGRALYDAYSHEDELAYSCQAGSDVCAIELTDSERGSAHDPYLVTWRATVEANGHYRCELRDRPEEAPVRYLADEGELGLDGAKALFARLLDGIATGEQDALTVDHGEAQDRNVALLERTEPDRSTIFKSRLRAPRVHLARDGALVRQRFVAMGSALGRRCVPPR